MLIIPEQKILYCHIHKNAGKSVRQMLKRVAKGISSDPKQVTSWNKIWKGKPIHGHATFKQVLRDHPDLVEYKKVAVIRNPFDRLASAYHYFKENPPEWQGINRTHVEYIDSFEEFIDKLYDTYLLFAINETKKNEFINNENITLNINRTIYPLQCSYLLDENGNMLADTLIHFESMEEEFKLFIEKELGIDALNYFNLGHIGSTNRASYHSLYTTDMIAKVQVIYQKDLELLNYEF